MYVGSSVLSDLGNAMKSTFFVPRILLAILVSLATSRTYSQKVKWTMTWQVIFDVSIARL